MSVTKYYRQFEDVSYIARTQDFLQFAKINIDANPETANKYKLKGDLQIECIVITGEVIGKLDPQAYRDQIDIRNWYQKTIREQKYGRHRLHKSRIDSVQELKELKASHKTVVAFFGSEDSEKFAAFKRASESLPDVPFVYSSDPALKEANRGHSLTVFTKRHNRGTHAHHFGRFDAGHILDYVENTAEVMGQM